MNSCIRYFLDSLIPFYQYLAAKYNNSVGGTFWRMDNYDLPINTWEAMNNYDLPINIWEAMTNINI